MNKDNNDENIAQVLDGNTPAPKGLKRDIIDHLFLFGASLLAFALLIEIGARGAGL